ncbi:MAG: hypothetical protein K9N23_04860 [Akkermansiaceae bacterium]|nr:hypothetical protein [Akkermansiaceae bacterium]MCF7730992.1 hypothetical protein [Akkermansiaceae bacterium]
MENYDGEKWNLISGAANWGFLGVLGVLAVQLARRIGENTMKIPLDLFVFHGKVPP